MAKSMSPKQIAMALINKMLSPERINPTREALEAINGKPLTDKRYEEAVAFIRENLENLRIKKYVPYVNKYCNLTGAPSDEGLQDHD